MIPIIALDCRRHEPHVKTTQRQFASATSKAPLCGRPAKLRHHDNAKDSPFAVSHRRHPRRSNRWPRRCAHSPKGTPDTTWRFLGLEHRLHNSKRWPKFPLKSSWLGTSQRGTASAIGTTDGITQNIPIKANSATSVRKVALIMATIRKALPAESGIMTCLASREARSPRTVNSQERERFRSQVRNAAPATEIPVP